MQVLEQLTVQVAQAQLTDAFALGQINNRYAGSSAIQGCSLPFLNTLEIVDKLKSHPESYYLAKTLQGEVIGFLELSNALSASILDGLAWFGKNYAQLLSKPETKYIERIVVKEEFLNRGIGSLLYEKLFMDLPNTLFTAFIQTAPIANTVSVNFHEGKGFKGVAEFAVPEFKHFEGYQSQLYVYQSNPTGHYL